MTGNSRQHFESEVNNGRVIRLIYQGQLLRDDGRSLASYGLTPGSVLHCHVSTTPLAAQAGPGSGPTAANRRPGSASPHRRDPEAAGGLGRFMYLLFGAKFLGFWAFYFRYPELFDATSIASLLLISAFVLAYLWHANRPRPQLPPNPPQPQPQPQPQPAQAR